MLGVELVTVNAVEGGALGAALLAGVGAGLWPDVDAACAAAVRVTGSTRPARKPSPPTTHTMRSIVASIPALRSLMHDLWPTHQSSCPEREEAQTCATAPYPPSDLITGLPGTTRIIRTGLGPIVNQETQRRDGSDNWPITWADDGELYVTYGDGYGFEPYLEGKAGPRLCAHLGRSRNAHPVNIRSASGENAGFGRNGKKGSGLLMVDGVLYLWLFHADEQGGQAQLAVSHDHAATWTL